MAPHDLRLFLTLCRELNFHKTSQRTHLAPSTLTRLIQRLETAVGAPLFHRDRKQVTLTNAGRLFQQYARETLASWESIQNRIRTTDTRLTGSLRLFCTVTASYSILPRLLPNFLQTHPGVRIAITTGDAAEALPRLIDSQVDAAIAPLPATLPPGLLAHTVATTRLDWIAPAQPPPHLRALLKEQPRPWEAIPLILPASGTIRERAIAWLQHHGAKPHIAGTVSGHEAIPPLVGLGVGLGVVPRLVLEHHPNDHIRPLKLQPALPPLVVGLCIRTERKDDPCLNAFWHALPSPGSPTSAEPSQRLSLAAPPSLLQ